jgi:Tfp pilus assembly protein PilE
MQLSPIRTQRITAFTLAEICVAIVVCLIFAGAAFAANQQLLIALRTQRETAAATMMLQERMESFRTIAYSQVASNQPSNSSDPTAWTAADIVQHSTQSEAVLGGFNETITVSGYLTTGGSGPHPNGYPGDGSTANQWVRNAQHPTGNNISTNNALVTTYDLIQVNILLTWTGANGRTRTRDLTAIFGKGNIGP